MGLQLLLLTARMDHCIHQELLCHVAYISNFHLYHVVFRIIKYMDSVCLTYCMQGIMFILIYINQC